jgi:hypothetical protein
MWEEEGSKGGRERRRERGFARSWRQRWRWEEISEGWDNWLGVFASTLHDRHWIWKIGPSYAAGDLGGFWSEKAS